MKLNTIHRNSFFLFTASISTMSLGFFFWVFAARLYTPKIIGFTTAIISAINLISNFSKLGMEVGIIRYIPTEENKSELINSCIALITVLSFIFSLLFLYILHVINKIVMINSSFAILFISISISFSIVTFQRNIFLSFKKAEYSMIQAILNASLKIILLPLLITAGAIGLLLSWGMPCLILVIYGVLIFKIKILKNHKIISSINIVKIKKILRFSIGNYLAEIFWQLPSRVFPIIIIATLSAKETAYFYIAWSIASILFLIPNSISMSLFAEGSYKNLENINISLIEKKIIKRSFQVLLPIVAIIIFAGKYILQIFGNVYSENSYLVLILLSISSIPNTVIELNIARERIVGKTTITMLSYLIISTITITIGFILLKVVGIAGIGVGWFIAQCTALLATTKYKRHIVEIE